MFRSALLGLTSVPWNAESWHEGGTAKIRQSRSGDAGGF